MKSLSDQIYQTKCKIHQHPNVFLCIEKDCKHDRRMLCDQCINLTDPSGLINITNTFEFLEARRVEQETGIQQCQAQLRQQFEDSKTQIMELLSYLEQLIEIFISQLLVSDAIQGIQENFIGCEMDEHMIDSLGQQLIGQIVLDQKGQCQFTQQVPLKEQNGYIQSTGILNAYKQAISVLNSQVNSMKDVIDNLQIQQIQSYDTPLSNFKLMETIQLDGSCMWLSFNHNKTQIAAAVDKSILIFDLQKEGQWIKNAQVLVGHTKSISQVIYNHNSTQIASCSEDQLILIWNKQQDGKWKLLDKLNYHANGVRSICYNNNSTLLVSGGDDKLINIYVFNKANWELTQQLTGEHTSYICDVCFNHDSTLLVSGSDDKSIIIRECNNVGKWIVKQILREHTEGVVRVSFNSNSTQLLSGSLDNSIKIWQVNNKQNWKCIHTLTGFTDLVKSVVFNQESNMIVSSGFDKQIRIWKINKRNRWECTEIINEHKDSVACVIISSDSSMIVSGSTDNTLKIHKQCQPS